MKATHDARGRSALIILRALWSEACHPAGAAVQKGDAAANDKSVAQAAHCPPFIVHRPWPHNRSTSTSTSTRAALD